MTFKVRPDGSYLRAIQLRKPRGQGCFMTTRQAKKGRPMRLASTQSTVNSCTGRTDWAAVPAMSETYIFSRAGNALRLRGRGAVSTGHSRDADRGIAASLAFAPIAIAPNIQGTPLRLTGRLPCRSDQFAGIGLCLSVILHGRMR
jgi:hypothetical protein